MDHLTNVTGLGARVEGGGVVRAGGVEGGEGGEGDGVVRVTGW
jgi:hypothetical protein